MIEHEWCDKEIGKLRNELNDKNKALMDANGKILRLECELNASNEFNDLFAKENKRLEAKIKIRDFILYAILAISVIFLIIQI